MPHKYDQEIQGLVRLTGNVTDAFTVALFLVEEKNRGRLSLKAFQSLSNSVIPNAVIRVGHGLVGWVAKHEKPTVATHFRHDATTLQFYSADEKIKSFAAVPVMANGRLLGALCVDSKQQYVFTDKKVKILCEFAETMANTIVLARKRIRLHSEAVDIQALTEITETITGCGTVGELAKVVRLRGRELIPHDQLTFAVRTPNEEQFRLVGGAGESVDETASAPFPLTHYRLGWVIRQARPMSLPDLDAPVIPGAHKKWRSFIGAPMIANSQVVGAIGMLSRRPEAFRAVDLNSLTILASICASSFTSLYLHGKTHSATLRDPLSGAASLRALLETYKTMWEDASVGIINLKNFSKVNAELGFGGGDQMLVDLAARLKRLVGERGQVCRFYGDRFIILLPRTPREQLERFFRMIAETIESQPFHCGGAEVYVIPAIGAASSPEDGRGPEQLLLKAQIAADCARQNPGSCVVFHGGAGPDAARLRSVR